MDRKQRDALRQRAVSAQAAIDNAPTTGSRGNYIKLPKKVKFFGPKRDKEYRLIFVPWTAGPNNRTCPKGEFGAWVRYLQVHKSIGPNSESFLCSAVFSKPCAVCEEFARLRAARADWKAVLKPLQAQNRAMSLVVDLDADPEAVMVWEEATFNFFEPLLLKVARKPKSWMAFFSLGDQGKVVEVVGREQKIETTSYTKFDSIEITDRETPVSDAVIDAAASLCPDDWVLETPYEKLKKILKGTGAPPEDKADSNTDGAEDEEVKEPEEEKEEMEEVEEPSDLEEPEPAPPTPKKAPSKKPVAKKEEEEPEEEPEEDEEEFDDDDDEPEPEEEEEPEPPKKTLPVKRKK